MNRSTSLAWFVHFYTSLGLPCALLALLAISEGRPREMFFWLAVAFAIDASDGVLARSVRVDLHTPHFSGRKLDDIIDYLNYTFVPICFIYQEALLTGPWLAALGFTLMASAYGFCSDNAKTADGFFTGFPSYWNVVAFYLFFLKPPELIAGTVVITLALMTFWPIRYLHPSKSSRVPVLSLGGGALWALGCLALLRYPDPAREWVYLSLLYPAWYMSYAFYLHFKEAPARGAA